MQDVYDFFYDVNLLLTGKDLERLDDMLRPAILSGMLSDMLTASIAKHSRTLVQNEFHNGHPDLIVRNKCEQRCSGGRGGRGGQDHQQARGSSGHPRRAGAVDVRLRPRDRRRDRACHRSRPFDVHRIGAEDAVAIEHEQGVVEQPVALADVGV